MEITVIIPSYKPMNYIWQCLSSLLVQTLPKEKFEVIIVLNGCKTPYYEQIMRFIREKEVTNFVVLQTDIPGVSNARNMGLDLAKGNYIAFIDDDDFVSPSYLEELLLVSSVDTIGISNELRYNEVGGSFEKEAFSYEFEKKSPRKQQPYYMIRRFLSGPCMKLLHRDIISSYRFDTKFINGEDGIFQFLISRNMKYVNFTSVDAIYYRRVRTNSAMSKEQKKFYLLKNRIRVMNKMIRIYFMAPLSYNIYFFITRLAANLKVIILGIISGKLIMYK